jgi:hypothetical protein
MNKIRIAAVVVVIIIAGSLILYSLFIGNGPVQTSNEGFNYKEIPTRFDVKAYSFAIVYNGTGYISANGTQYMGFDVVLNVSHSGASQTANFQWNPYGPDNDLPSPVNVSLYGGAVTMGWSTNSSGLFLLVGAR